MRDDLEKLIAAIKKGKPATVYLIFGDQEYRVSQAEAALVDALIPEADRAFGLATLDGAMTDWGEVLANLKTVPMFGDRKVVVVRDARLAGANVADAIFTRARAAWMDGSESRRKTAVGHLMNLLGAAGWPIGALGTSGPDARNCDDWKKELKVKATDSDLEWLEEARTFAMGRGMSPKPDDKDDPLREYLETSTDTRSILVITAADVDKRLGVFKVIDKKGAVLEFAEVKGEKAQKAFLREEIEEMLQKSGKRLAPNAFEKLERKTGFNLRAFAGELEKIITYVGDAKSITADDVDAVVPQTREESVFELADAVGRRDGPKSLKLLTDLLDQEYHPLELLGHVHRTLLNLYLATDYARGAAGRFFRKGMYYPDFQKNVFPKIKEKEGRFSKLHPFVMFKSLEQQENYDRLDLEDGLRAVAAADARLKSSRADPRFVLEEVLFELCLK